MSKSLTQPLTVGIVAFEKAGARGVILHADPPDHVTADWRRRLVLQAVESRDRLSEAGLAWPLPSTLTDVALEAMLLPALGSRPGRGARLNRTGRPFTANCADAASR